MTFDKWVNENYPTIDSKLELMLHFTWIESRTELIKEQFQLKSLNTKNGIQKSKKTNGRPKIPNRKKYQAKLHHKNGMKYKDICQRLNIGRTSLYKIIKEDL